MQITRTYSISIKMESRIQSTLKVIPTKGGNGYAQLRILISNGYIEIDSSESTVAIVTF
jgi:hypothetical protein